MSAVFTSWTVYEKPRDFPRLFVARRFEWDQPTKDFIVGPSLDAVRAQLPAGLMCLSRSPEDDPMIVEIWM